MALGVAVSIVSAAALGYEILLMRLFSIIQWHHFAYMIISLALLGIGASGAALSLARAWLVARFAAAFPASAALFGVSAVAAAKVSLTSKASATPPPSLSAMVADAANGEPTT